MIMNMAGNTNTVHFFNDLKILILNDEFLSFFKPDELTTQIWLNLLSADINVDKFQSAKYK